jgi:hypothetical protein
VPLELGDADNPDWYYARKVREERTLSAPPRAAESAESDELATTHPGEASSPVPAG